MTSEVNGCRILSAARDGTGNTKSLGGLDAQEPGGTDPMSRRSMDPTMTTNPLMPQKV